MLLRCAREAIIEAVCHGDLPRVLRNDGIFGERRGVFVTLRVHQRLRGCIGVVDTPGDDRERVPHPRTVRAGPGQSSERSEPVSTRGDDDAEPSVQIEPLRVPHPRTVRVGPDPSGEHSEPVSRRGDDDTEPPHTIEPLGSSIVRCAAGAALGDPRFPSIRPDEIPDLRIEISLLSPPVPIRPEQIEIGRHGLLITSEAAPPASKDDSAATSSSGPPRFASGDGSVKSSSGAPPSVFEGASAVKRGVLLPQVAVEHHLTPEQFLAETCRKAGLPPDAWRLPAEAGHPDSSPEHAPRVQLFAFTSQVFSEPIPDFHPVIPNPSR